MWDPHPRGATPVPGVTLATPNLDEARTASGVEPDAHDWLATASRAGAALRAAWRADGVAVTAGSRGAVLPRGRRPRRRARPGRRPAADPCGAGDRFAGATALALAAGRTGDEAVSDAVAAAGTFVAGGGAGAVRRDDAGRWHAPGLAPAAPSGGTEPDGDAAGPREALAVVRPPGPAAAGWSPPAAASTCCTPGTPARCRRGSPGPATSSSSASTPTPPCAG